MKSSIFFNNTRRHTRDLNNLFSCTNATRLSEEIWYKKFMYVNYIVEVEKPDASIVVDPNCVSGIIFAPAHIQFIFI